MPGTLFLYPGCAQCDTDHVSCAHVSERHGGYGVGKQSIHEQAAINIDWMKHSRIGATGADRVNQFTAGEDGRLAGHYVRGSYGQRNAQLFEGLARLFS